MLESQLKLGNELIRDREIVYRQMKDMKLKISDCKREGFETEDVKEGFDDFKQSLLELCDKWVEDQRKGIDDRFAKI